MLFHNIQQYSNATDKYEYDRLVKKFYDYCLDLLPHGCHTTLIENFNYRMYPGELAYELYDLYAKRELLLLRCHNSATHQSNVDVSVRKSLIGKLLELTDGPGFALCITTQSIAIFDRCVSKHQYEKEDVSILMAAAIQLSVAYFHIRHHDMHLPCVELFVGEINVTNEKDDDYWEMAIAGMACAIKHDLSPEDVILPDISFFIDRCLSVVENVRPAHVITDLWPHVHELINHVCEHVVSSHLLMAKYKPSELGAACVFIAKSELGFTGWTNELAFFSECSVAHVKKVANDVLEMSQTDRVRIPRPDGAADLDFFDQYRTGWCESHEFLKEDYIKSAVNKTAN